MTNRPLAQTVLAIWLVFHAMISAYTLVSRSTSILEWSILLLFFVCVGVLIAGWINGIPRKAMLFTFAVLIYDIGVSLGTFTYGLILSSRYRLAGEPLERKYVVPIEEPLYLVLMIASTGCAMILGGLYLINNREQQPIEVLGENE